MFTACSKGDDDVVRFSKVDLAMLTANKTYDNNHGSLLSAYPRSSIDTYEGVCVYYEEEEWSLYCENNMNGNFFSTYTKDSKIAHVYWIASQSELNIITAENGAENLPPQKMESSGNIPTSVTQLQQNAGQTSGMAYIVQLDDGSFIIYDGGYADTVAELLHTLKSLSNGKDIHIRAWVITHSHDDHYSCFEELAENYDSRYKLKYSINITLDYLLIAPISNSQAIKMDYDGNFFVSKLETCLQPFPNAKICYVHTGMKLNFRNLTMEILFTPEELFIDGSTDYFNDSSIVSRIYSNKSDSGDTMSMIFLGDAGVSVADRLMSYYGDYLKSDMCQVSHHGVENFPLSAYQFIKAPILFYPCNTTLYNRTDRFDDVRKALRDSEITTEILLRDDEKYQRFFNPSLNPAPVGKPF